MIASSSAFYANDPALMSAESFGSSMAVKEATVASMVSSPEYREEDDSALYSDESASRALEDLALVSGESFASVGAVRPEPHRFIPSSGIPQVMSGESFASAAAVKEEGIFNGETSTPITGDGVILSGESFASSEAVREVPYFDERAVMSGSSFGSSEAVREVNGPSSSLLAKARNAFISARPDQPSVEEDSEILSDESLASSTAIKKAALARESFGSTEAVREVSDPRYGFLAKAAAAFSTKPDQSSVEEDWANSSDGSVTSSTAVKTAIAKSLSPPDWDDSSSNRKESPSVASQDNADANVDDAENTSVESVLLNEYDSTDMSIDSTATVVGSVGTTSLYIVRSDSASSYDSRQPVVDGRDSASGTVRDQSSAPPDKDANQPKVKGLLGLGKRKKKKKKRLDSLFERNTPLRNSNLTPIHEEYSPTPRKSTAASQFSDSSSEAALASNRSPVNSERNGGSNFGTASAMAVRNAGTGLEAHDANATMPNAILTVTAGNPKINGIDNKKSTLSDVAGVNSQGIELYVIDNEVVSLLSDETTPSEIARREERAAINTFYSAPSISSQSTSKQSSTKETLNILKSHANSKTVSGAAVVPLPNCKTVRGAAVESTSKQRSTKGAPDDQKPASDSKMVKGAAVVLVPNSKTVRGAAVKSTSKQRSTKSAPDDQKPAFDSKMLKGAAVESTSKQSYAKSAPDDQKPPSDSKMVEGSAVDDGKRVSITDRYDQDVLDLQGPMQMSEDSSALSQSFEESILAIRLSEYDDVSSDAAKKGGSNSTGPMKRAEQTISAVSLADADDESVKDEKKVKKSGKSRSGFKPPILFLDKSKLKAKDSLKKRSSSLAEDHKVTTGKSHAKASTSKGDSKTSEKKAPIPRNDDNQVATESSRPKVGEKNDLEKESSAPQGNDKQVARGRAFVKELTTGTDKDVQTELQKKRSASPRNRDSHLAKRNSRTLVRRSSKGKGQFWGLRSSQKKSAGTKKVIDKDSVKTGEATDDEPFFGEDSEGRRDKEIPNNKPIKDKSSGVDPLQSLDWNESFPTVAVKNTKDRKRGTIDTKSTAGKESGKEASENPDGNESLPPVAAKKTRKDQNREQTQDSSAPKPPSNRGRSLFRFGGSRGRKQSRSITPPKIESSSETPLKKNKSDPEASPGVQLSRSRSLTRMLNPLRRNRTRSETPPRNNLRSKSPPTVQRSRSRSLKRMLNPLLRRARSLSPVKRVKRVRFGDDETEEKKHAPEEGSHHSPFTLDTPTSSQRRAFRMEDVPAEGSGDDDIVDDRFNRLFACQPTYRPRHSRKSRSSTDLQDARSLHRRRHRKRFVDICCRCMYELCFEDLFFTPDDVSLYSRGSDSWTEGDTYTATMRSEGRTSKGVPTAVTIRSTAYSSVGDSYTRHDDLGACKPLLQANM